MRDGHRHRLREGVSRRQTHRRLLRRTGKASASGSQAQEDIDDIDEIFKIFNRN